MPKKKASAEAHLTAIIYQEFDYLPKFYVIDGDHRQFDGVIVNVDVDDKGLGDFMYSKEDGTELHKPVTLAEFGEAVRHGAHVICCGFAP